MMSVMESITADIHYIWFAATQQYVSLHEGDDELHYDTEFKHVLA